MDSEHVYGVTEHSMITPGRCRFMVFDASYGVGIRVGYAVSREAAERLILCLKGG
jgi:hypothetical protein